jgi:hypothetical protein
MTTFSITIIMLILAALIAGANVFSLRLSKAANGSTRNKKAMAKAIGAYLLNYGVLVVVFLLWFAVAAMTSQSEKLHDAGFGLYAFGGGFVNAALLWWTMYVGWKE